MRRLRCLGPALLVFIAACGSTTDGGAPDAASKDAAEDARAADGADAGIARADGGDGGAPADASMDGLILFRGLGEGIFFDVELYAPPVPAPGEIVRGDGHCDVHAVGAGDSFVRVISPGTLDLGPSVTASSSTLAFSAPVDRTGGGFQYQFGRAGVDAFAKTWTLENAGSPSGLAATTLATVHVPTRVVPIVPAPEGGSVDTRQRPVVLRWTGGAGAETLHVNIQSSRAEVDCYPAPTATSFELPADVLDALDPVVTPALWAESIAVVDVGARRVWARVTSDNLD